MMEFDEETNLIKFKEMLLDALNKVEDALELFENQNTKVIDLNTLQRFQMQDFSGFN